MYIGAAQYLTFLETNLQTSVWKPLRGPVYDAPLAVCDYQTLDYEDRVPTDIIFPDYLGETYHIWPNPKHRWYYIDGQQTNEALMIKCHDSKTSDDPSIAQCKFSSQHAPILLSSDNHLELRTDFYTSKSLHMPHLNTQSPHLMLLCGKASR